jgi:hypothetical protein
MKNLLILMFVATFFIIGCSKQDNNTLEQSVAALDQQFEEYKIVTLDVASIVAQTAGKYDAAFTLNLDLEEKPEWVFNVKYHDFYHKDYTFYESNAQGDWVEVARTGRSDAYHGSSINKAHKALFIVRDYEITATIFEDGREVIIEPLANYVEGSPADQYIYYFVEADKEAENHTCGVSEEEIAAYQQSVDHHGHPHKADQCRDMSITYVADYEYRGKFSNNTTNTRNYIEDRIKFASYRYWNYNDYPLYFNLYTAYVRTTTSNPPTTSTNSSTALSQFRTWARANISTRDCSLLFTGRNFGTLFGKAYVGTVCKFTSGGDKRAFGMVTKNSGISSGTYNKVTAHEVGHTLGCSHQTSGFMKQGNHSTTGMATATEQELDAYIASNNSCMPLRNCVNFD